MTTPIQMIQAVGAIANDGIMMKPHIVKAIYYNDHTEVIQPEVVGRPISAETAHTVTDMLETSLEVEASDALLDGVKIAGKTGTGEIAKEGYGSVLNVTNASFVGWGPSDDPHFIAYVWLQEPWISIGGSEGSATLFSDVRNEIMPYLHIPYDRQRACLDSKTCPTEVPKNEYY